MISINNAALDALANVFHGCLLFADREIPYFAGFAEEITTYDEREVRGVKVASTAIVRTDDEILIVTHGTKNGDIDLIDNQALEVLTDPDNDLPVYIHCCYPKRVAAAHPELVPYLLNADHDYIQACIVTISASWAVALTKRFPIC